MTFALLTLSSLAAVLGITRVAYLVALERPPSPPQLGRRGRRRKRALRGSVSFRFVEPLLRCVGAWLHPLVPLGFRRRIERALMEAGYPLGLSVDELAASSALAFLVSFAFLTLTTRRFEDYLVLGVVGASVMAALPVARLSAVRKRRGKRITRSLPPVLELVVLCLSAGLDLPRALRCVVDSAADPFDPIVEELDVVVRELELGRTRKDALRGLAHRVTSVEVKEIVNSVIQSEEKGVALSKALTIQSRTLKLRRSMSAERAASGAALMLVGPMSLIFLCVIALLLGPVILRTTAGGFGI